ncbi:hypothetical protein PGIGA_G00043950 [Pangasianodon gigas]|uniref:Uncharacterized protein n=1 Tax=Pangasianodon gigas TaxID=30993 RepID=A0ACC5X0V1_PANGG|nr:hypothetical protein [Pangasianodon gigas]
MGKGKDLSDFDKGQIVMARRLGQSISKTAGLVGCSRYAVVSTYQKWSKEGQPVNQRESHGCPRLTDVCEERRLAHLVRSHRRATVVQVAEKVNAGYDRNTQCNAACCVWGCTGQSAHADPCPPLKAPTMGT